METFIWEALLEKVHHVCLATCRTPPQRAGLRPAGTWRIPSADFQEHPPKKWIFLMWKSSINIYKWWIFQMWDWKLNCCPAEKSSVEPVKCPIYCPNSTYDAWNSAEWLGWVAGLLPFITIYCFWWCNDDAFCESWPWLCVRFKISVARWDSFFEGELQCTIDII